MNNEIQHEYFKFASIIPLLLLSIGLIAAWNTPATGYEPSIYEATPLFYWIGISACYIIGIGLTFIATFYDNISKLIKYNGYLLIILASISLISLTVLRGYGILNISGDGGTHIGFLSKTVISGFLPNTYYPGVYAEPAVFQILTGLDTNTVLTLYPLFMICLFTLGIYLLAKRVFPKKGEVYFATIIALLLPFGSSTLFGTSDILYAGMTIANIGLLPIFLYLILRSIEGAKNIFILLAILSLSILFYHPYVTVTCFVIYFAVIIVALISQRKYNTVSKKSITELLCLFVIMLGTFFGWYWNYFGGKIINGLMTIFYATDLDSRELASSVDLFQQATDYGFSLDTVFRIAGINLFIYGMFLVAFLFLLRYHWKDERYFLFKVLFICAIFIGGMMVIAAVGNFGGGYLRFRIPIYIVSLLSSGFVLYKIASTFSGHKAAVSVKRLGAVFLILMFVGGVSVMSFHPSPYTLNIGYQTTQTEFTGAETLLPYIDYDKNTTGITFTGLHRYVSAIYGSEYTVGSYAYGDYHIITALRGGTNYADGVPYHFGYDLGSSLSDNYGEGEYIFIIEKDTKFYQAYYPEMMQYRWTPDDFDHLGMDGGLSYVYDNGGLEMYVIR